MSGGPVIRGAALALALALGAALLAVYASPAFAVHLPVWMIC